MANTSVHILNTSIKTNRQLLQNVSQNIALRDVEGYTKKTIHLTKNSAEGLFTGVDVSEAQRKINLLLQQQLLTENADLSAKQTLEEYYGALESVFGCKGAEISFANDMSRLADSLNNIGNSAESIRKSTALDTADLLVKNLSSIAEKIQSLRTKADHEIGLVITECTDKINGVVDLNKQITNFKNTQQDSTSLEDDRDLLIHQLSGNIDIRTLSDETKKISISTRFGDILVQEALPGKLTFIETALAPPGMALSPILLNGRDITPQITEGKLRALIDIRDKILPNFQKQLDEITRNLRDQLNAIHNEGTGSIPRQTITGTTGVPGFEQPLTGNEILSGTGTLRLASLTENGQIRGYKDISLNNNMTTSNLIDLINNTPYGDGHQDGTINAALTAEGKIQLTTLNGYGISIGSVDPTQARISLGNAYDATTSYGFSHFFGFNNLFETGRSLASSNHQVGLTNILKIREDLLADPNKLACGRLSSKIPPSENNEGGLGLADTSITTRMSNALKSEGTSFAEAGSIPPRTTTLIDYSAEVISSTESKINNNRGKLERQQIIYDTLAKQAHDFSSVDPSEELLNVMEIASSESLATKALSIILQMTRELAQTIGG